MEAVGGESVARLQKYNRFRYCSKFLRLVAYEIGVGSFGKGFLWYSIAGQLIPVQGDLLPDTEDFLYCEGSVLK